MTDNEDPRRLLAGLGAAAEVSGSAALPVTGGTEGSARRLRRLAGRSGATLLVDQFLNSASNGLLVLAISRSGSSVGVQARLLGAYAVAILVFAMARAMTGEALLSVVAVSRDRLGRALRLSSRAAIAAASATLVIALLIGAASSTWRKPVLVVGATLALAIIQDALRYRVLASGRVRPALVSDGAWTALVVVAWVAAPRISAFTASAVWGAGAAIGIAILLVGRSSAAHLSEVSARTYLVMGTALAGNQLLALGSTQLMTALALSFDRPERIVALRVAQTMMAPANVVFAWVLNLRLLRPRSRERRLPYSAIGSVFLILVILWLLPTVVGEAIAGPQWSAARPLAVWLGLALVALGPILHPMTMLRRHVQPRQILVRQVVATGWFITLCGAGLEIAGVTGFCVGQFLAAVAASVGWNVFMPPTPGPAPRSVNGMEVPEK